MNPTLVQLEAVQYQAILDALASLTQGVYIVAGVCCAVILAATWKG